MAKTYYRWRGHAEEIFANYRRNKREIRAYLASLSYSRTGNDGGSRGSRVSDPTARAAVTALSDVRYQELQRQTAAVKKILKALPQRKANLMRRVYIEHRCTLQGAAAYFGVSYATARRWKQQACLALAYELGWIG